jgi:hypothetical protein
MADVRSHEPTESRSEVETVEPDDINKENKNMENLVLHQLITELHSSISEEYTHAYFILRGELLCCCNIFEIPSETEYVLK